MSFVLKLDHPFKKADGTTCAEVTMRRASVKDLRIMHNSGKSDAEKELKLAGNLCQLSPDELDCMDASDYATLQEQLKVFTSPRAS